MKIRRKLYMEYILATWINGFTRNNGYPSLRQVHKEAIDADFRFFLENKL